MNAGTFLSPKITIEKVFPLRIKNLKLQKYINVSKHMGNFIRQMIQMMIQILFISKNSLLRQNFHKMPQYLIFYRILIMDNEKSGKISNIL